MFAHTCGCGDQQRQEVQGEHDGAFHPTVLPATLQLASPLQFTLLKPVVLSACLFRFQVFQITSLPRIIDLVLLLLFYYYYYYYY